MFYYYNKEKALEQKLVLVQTTSTPYDFNMVVEEEETIPTPRMVKEEVVVYESDAPFIGTPYVDGDKVRPATVEEMVELGVITLRSNELIVDGNIIPRQIIPTRTQEIDAELTNLTFKADRPTQSILSAMLKGETPNAYDVAILNRIEKNKEDLRMERAKLQVNSGV